jgi:hypothetical protein
MKYLLLAGLLLALPAAAQPEQPIPATSTPVEDALAAAPHVDISNGVITARIAPPDLSKGFYRGTRFDQAGVITSLTFRIEISTVPGSTVLRRRCWTMPMTRKAAWSADPTAPPAAQWRNSPRWVSRPNRALS